MMIDTQSPSHRATESQSHSSIYIRYIISFAWQTNKKQAINMWNSVMVIGIELYDGFVNCFNGNRIVWMCAIENIVY